MKTVSIRLGDERYRQLVEEAGVAHRSLAAHVLWLLEEALRLKAMIEQRWQVGADGEAVGHVLHARGVYNGADG